MGLRIGSNVNSMVATRALNLSSQAQSKASQRLATGQRINSGSDDGAGLAIGENLRAQIRSLRQAERNAQDGISLVQTAEGGLNEIGNLLVRMRELAIQASSDTLSDRERKLVDLEYQSSISEIDRLANVTVFNDTPLLNGKSPHGTMNFQVGIYNRDEDHIEFEASETDVRASSLGVRGLHASSKGDAESSLDSIDQAMHQVAEARTRFGAMQNRLQAAANNIGVSRENFEEARSRIMDTDVAEEASNLVRANLLSSAGIAVLSQANQAPYQALKLIA